jgi:Domain of unknown function (DUF4926)
MFQESDLVVLLHDIPEHGLPAGDLGTVVMVHGKGRGYEVEFATLGGETIDVITVRADEIRPVKKREIAHVGEVA